MGTRSRIGVMHGDNCKSVYCHWDGYLEHNGRILLDHYDSARANNLVALGDLSILGEEIEPSDELHSFEHPENDVCVFYGRDRKETGTAFKTTDTFDKFLELADHCGAEYYYIMKDGEWYCGTTYGSHTKLGGKLVPLAEALADVDIEASEKVTA